MSAMTAMRTAVGAARRDAEAAPEGAAHPQRVAVPWLTVVPLAALLAYADGFWVMSLRGAVGAIERSQTPLVSWLRESTLVLPVFVLAVLGALTLAMRWFGPQVSSPRRVVATALLVVAAGTLAGTAWLVASAAYDYHLQAAQVAMMGSMGTVCSVGKCLALQEHATLALQVRAAAYGIGILVAANLVGVTWLVALRGGRMTLSTTRPQAAAGPTGTDRAEGSRREDLRLLLVGALVAAGVVHAAVVPEHLHEWTAAGAFFVLLTAAELAVAVQVMGGVRRNVLLAAAAVSAGPLVVWLYSRTLGLPFGPEPGAAEHVGLADGAAVVLEVGALVVIWLLARAGERERRPAASAHVRGLALAAVLAVTTVGLGGTGLALFNATGSVDDHSRTHGAVTPAGQVAVPTSLDTAPSS
jgi:hypothetical protein